MRRRRTTTRQLQIVQSIAVAWTLAVATVSGADDGTGEYRAQGDDADRLSGGTADLDTPTRSGQDGAALLPAPAPAPAAAINDTAADLSGSGPGSVADTAEGEAIYIFGTSPQRDRDESTVTPAMRAGYSPATSVVKLLETLPGITVAEGDIFGSDDWSTMITIRGLQSENQHIGTTIDGLPNGGSNYGGGAKGNRFIDAENLAEIAVTYGANDDASLSTEALGGTIDYHTDDPRPERGGRAALTLGTQNARRLFVRADTGEIAPGWYAYGSYSNTYLNRWVDNTGFARRDHLAVKAVGALGRVRITGRYSFDDVREDNYQTVSLAQFRDNPSWDRLLGEWTGIPYIDQAYRQVWVTERRNHFAYVKAATEVAGFQITLAPYLHRMRGRGDWTPPYLVEVDGVMPGPGQTLLGGESSATVQYTDSAGQPLAPSDGCTAEYTFPYGNSGPRYHPDCYPDGAVPVSSYRHTHYGKIRRGASLRIARRDRLGPVDNRLRAGLWYEDYELERQRDWHRIIDSTASHHFADTPYWVQFDRTFSQQMWMWHVTDQMDIGRLSLSAGIRQFVSELQRRDSYGAHPVLRVDAGSSPLINARARYRVGKHLQLTAGYGQSYASVKEFVIDRGEPVDGADGEPIAFEPLNDIRPETARTLELGARFAFDTRIGAWRGSVSLYDLAMNDRIVQISAQAPEAGIDFRELADSGIPRNIGGISARGVETALGWDVNRNWQVRGTYSYNRAVYADDVATLGVFAGNRVIMAPAHTLVAGLTYRDPQRWRVGVNARYVGAHAGTLGDEPGVQEQIPGYVVGDAYLGYALPTAVGLDVALRVNNLANARYITGSAGGGGAYLLGPPRAVTLTLSSQL